MKPRIITHGEIDVFTQSLADSISQISTKPLKVYPIPRGGVAIAYLLKNYCNITIVDDPKDCDIFIDDLIDSGATYERYCSQYPGKPFLPLIDKRELTFKNQWLVFPWELGENNQDNSAEDIVIRLLEFVGEDPKRGGLLETPQRVIKAWKDWCSGYNKNPEDVLKVFEDGAESYNQMIVVLNLPFYSHCEHHLAPFFGTVSIAYLPKGKIVGLSKFHRLVDIFSRRLQVQERLTDQIAAAIQNSLDPYGVGVFMKARHLCMESRGICKQGHETITTALTGLFSEQPSVKAEFLNYVNQRSFK